mgnify:CR=1 FL=1
MLSDERIEIAERMRGPFDVCECVGHTYINGTVFGMQVCARDEQELRNGMRHLAELIDPTCKMVVKNGHACCGRCGHRLADEWEVEEDLYEFRPYCPDCGCRVVTRDGHE